MAKKAVINYEIRDGGLNGEILCEPELIGKKMTLKLKLEFSYCGTNFTSVLWEKKLVCDSTSTNFDLDLKEYEFYNFKDDITIIPQIEITFDDKLLLKDTKITRELEYNIIKSDARAKQSFEEHGIELEEVSSEFRKSMSFNLGPDFKIGIGGIGIVIFLIIFLRILGKNVSEQTFYFIMGAMFLLIVAFIIFKIFHKPIKLKLRNKNIILEKGRIYDLKDLFSGKVRKNLSNVKIELLALNYAYYIYEYYDKDYEYGYTIFDIVQMFLEKKHRHYIEIIGKSPISLNVLNSQILKFVYKGTNISYYFEGNFSLDKIYENYFPNFRQGREKGIELKIILRITYEYGKYVEIPLDFSHFNKEDFTFQSPNFVKNYNFKSSIEDLDKFLRNTYEGEIKLGSLAENTPRLKLTLTP